MLKVNTIDATLSRNSILRLLIHFIDARQSHSIACGLIAKHRSIRHLYVSKGQEAVENCEIAETSLGFDSLSRLELAMEVSLFFNLHTSGIDDYLLVRHKIADWIDLIQSHFKKVGVAASLTFQTSGSLGQSKPCLHTVRSLSDEISALLEGPLAKCSATGRIISLVPPQHIYGFLFTCLLPSRTNRNVIDVSLSSMLQTFEVARPGDVIIATPYIWDLLARSGLRLRKDVFGVTSAGPATPTTWSVQEKIGVHKLIEIYGSTETAGIGYRLDQDARFSLFAHLSQRSGSLRKIGTPDETLALQDHLTWHTENTFSLNQRRDDAVQVAGVNISPKYVAEVLCSADVVADAIVRWDGAHLKAFIVPIDLSQDHTEIIDQVHACTVNNLAAPARPNCITIGKHLPRNAMGKLTDWNHVPSTPTQGINVQPPG